MKLWQYPEGALVDGAVLGEGGATLPALPVTINDVQHGPEIFEFWTEKELEAIGITPAGEDLTAEIKAEIAYLEAQQTPRRVREAALGLDDGWLKDLNTKIAALRAKM